MIKPLRRGRDSLCALLILGTTCLTARAQGVITPTEPNDSIGTATATGFAAGSSGIKVAYGNNGDGPYGPQGDMTGDMDFYKVSANAGQTIKIDLKNASASDDFDSAVAIFPATGNVPGDTPWLVENDDIVNGAIRSSALTYTVTAAGDYYICVSNWINAASSYPTDPLTPGTGLGLPGGTPGPYQLFIGLDYNGPIPQFEGSGKGNPTPGLAPVNFLGTAYSTSSLKISNTGTAAWTVTASAITGPDAAKFTIPDLHFPLTLAPGASRAFKVLINTLGNPETLNAELDLTSNDPLDIKYAMSYQRPPSVVTGGGTFEAKMVYSTVALNSMALADATLAGTSAGTSVTVQTPRINYGTGADGKFPSDTPFFNPGSMDNFTVQVKGNIFIKTADTYTFYGYSDDGQRLKIDGVELYSYNDANTDHFGVAELTAGVHTVEYTMYEGAGGNSAELQIAREPGTFGAYGETTWELLEAYGPDTDGDGIYDYIEVKVATDPLVADAGADPDADTISNINEVIFGTNPKLADTDSDGLNDNLETGTGLWASATDTGTNPLMADTDSDGFLDGVENPGVATNGLTQPGTDPNKADTDGDTFADYYEVAFGTSPKDAASKPTLTFQQVFSENFETDNPHSDYRFNTMNSTAFIPGTVESDTAAAGTVAQLTGFVGSSHNSLTFDAVNITSTAAVQLGFDFRIGFNQDDFGTSADGFGIGLFRTGVYGQRGVSPLIVNAKSWENPSGGGGYADALLIGFSVYGTDAIRLFGPAAPAVPLATYNPPANLVSNILGEVKPYNRAVVTIVTNSPTSSVVSMEIIRDVYGAATREQVFTSVPVPGFQITSETLRLIAGARTGSFMTQNELDNITYSIQVQNNPSLVFSSSSAGAGFIADFYDGSVQGVNAGTMQVTLNGAPLAVTPVKTANNTKVNYTLAPGTLLPPGTNTAVFSYTSTTGAALTETRTFTVDPYVTLPGALALPVTAGITPGFNVRTVQMDPIDLGTPEMQTMPNSLDYREGILSGVSGSPFVGGNMADPAGATNGTYLSEVINFEQASGAAGFFAENLPIPGIPGTTGSNDNYVFEALSWINFPMTGVYTLGVVTDDGYRVSYTHKPVGALSVAAPASAVRIVPYLPSVNGAQIAGIAAPYPAVPITVDVVAADPPTATNTADPAFPGLLNNAAACAGKIVLIDRGSGGFVTKIRAAQAAGAVAAIIINQNNPNSLPAGLGGDGSDLTTITIPAGMISKSDGDALKALIASGLRMTLGPDESTTMGKSNVVASTTFNVSVVTPGLYPVRFLSFEGGGGANAEFFSVDSAGVRHLVNSPDDELSLKAYASVTAGTEPTISVSRTGGSVVITFTGTLQSSTDLITFGNVQNATSPYTVPAGSPPRMFFRAVR
ncbi:MAG: PA domain-containing protein [Verrucomicrobiota bacterium]